MPNLEIANLFAKVNADVKGHALDPKSFGVALKSAMDELNRTIIESGLRNAERKAWADLPNPFLGRRKARV